MNSRTNRLNLLLNAQEPQPREIKTRSDFHVTSRMRLNAPNDVKVSYIYLNETQQEKREEFADNLHISFGFMSLWLLNLSVCGLDNNKVTVTYKASIEPASFIGGNWIQYHFIIFTYLRSLCRRLVYNKNLALYSNVFLFSLDSFDFSSRSMIHEQCNDDSVLVLPFLSRMFPFLKYFQWLNSSSSDSFEELSLKLWFCVASQKVSVPLTPDKVFS